MLFFQRIAPPASNLRDSGGINHSLISGAIYKLCGRPVVLPHTAPVARRSGGRDLYLYFPQGLVFHHARLMSVSYFFTQLILNPPGINRF